MRWHPLHRDTITIGQATSQHAPAAPSNPPSLAVATWHIFISRLGELTRRRSPNVALSRPNRAALSSTLVMGCFSHASTTLSSFLGPPSANHTPSPACESPVVHVHDPPQYATVVEFILSLTLSIQQHNPPLDCFGNSTCRFCTTTPISACTPAGNITCLASPAPANTK